MFLSDDMNLVEVKSQKRKATVGLTAAWMRFPFQRRSTYRLCQTQISFTEKIGKANKAVIRVGMNGVGHDGYLLELE